MGTGRGGSGGPGDSAVGDERQPVVVLELVVDRGPVAQLRRASCVAGQLSPQRRVADELASIASTYEEPEKVVEMYSRDAELMNSLKSRVIEDQVVEWIVEHAQVTDQELSFDQVMKPQQA